MRLRYCLLIITALAFLSLSTFSQNTLLHPRFDHITVNNGLSHSDAMAVIQDKDGFIWIGTNKGLDRYDGNTIKNYSFSVNNPYTLPGNRISSLHINPSGVMWVGGERGICYYDKVKDRFVRINESLVLPDYLSSAQILENAFVSAIAEDENGNVFIGTQENGLFVFHRNKSENLASLRRVALENYDMDFGITDIKLISGKGIWIGTTANGLYYLPVQQESG